MSTVLGPTFEFPKNEGKSAEVLCSFLAEAALVS